MPTKRAAHHRCDITPTAKSVFSTPYLVCSVVAHHNPPYLVCKTLVRLRRVFTPNGLVCFKHRIWCAITIGVTAHF